MGWDYYVCIDTSSSRSSDGNSSLLDEGSSASQVSQASVELAGYGSVVWPDSLSEWQTLIRFLRFMGTYIFFF